MLKNAPDAKKLVCFNNCYCPSLAQKCDEKHRMNQTAVYNISKQIICTQKISIDNRNSNGGESGLKWPPWTQTVPNLLANVTVDKALAAFNCWPSPSTDMSVLLEEVGSFPSRSQIETIFRRMSS